MTNFTENDDNYLEYSRCWKEIEQLMPCDFSIREDDLETMFTIYYYEKDNQRLYPGSETWLDLKRNKNIDFEPSFKKIKIFRATKS